MRPPIVSSKTVPLAALLKITVACFWIVNGSSFPKRHFVLVLVYLTIKTDLMFKCVIVLHRIFLTWEDFEDLYIMVPKFILAFGIEFENTDIFVFVPET